MLPVPDSEGVLSMHDIATLVLAGGRGHRLRPLTAHRAKPVMPFAGRHLIDFTLANCLRSGVRDVVVCVQYRAAEVAGYLEEHWAPRFRGLLLFSPTEAGRMFRGTADAVRAALGLVDGRRLLVLAGDHVYRMDYRRLLADHEAAAADATISVVPVPRREASRLGVLTVGEGGLVEAFHEKTAAPPVAPGRPDECVGSMGIYLFERPTLAGFLADFPAAVDFGHHVLPGLVAGGVRVATHAYAAAEPHPYWRDIADVHSYHAALMDVADHRFDAGAPANHATVGGGATVKHSVFGHGVRIGPGAAVVDSVLLDRAVVGAGARLQRVVVEEGASVPACTRLGGAYAPVRVVPANARVQTTSGV
jgi:glucose-1-phosphate adenylyltransferase